MISYRILDFLARKDTTVFPTGLSFEEADLFISDEYVAVIYVRD